MRRLIFLACAVTFLDATFFAVLAPILPDYRNDLNLSEAAAGVLSGAYAAGTLAMALPGGWIAARFGPKRAVVAGLIGIAIFSPVFGFADQLWLLDLSRFCQGATGALLWAGSMTWVITVGRQEDRGALVGIVVAAAVVGELCGAPLGALAHQVGTEIVFGAVLFAAVILLAIASTIRGVAIDEPQSIGRALAVLKDANPWPAIWLLAAPSFAFGVTVVVGPLKMDDLGATAFLIAAAFAAGSVAEAFTGPVVGRYSDRIGRTGPFVIGVCVVAVGLLAVGLFDVLPIVFAAVVLTAFGSGMAFTPSIALLTDVAEAAGLDQGYASGASNAAWGGAQMVGALGGGLLAGASFLLPCALTAALLGVAALVARGIAEKLTEQPIIG